MRKTFRHHDAVRGLGFSVAEGSACALSGANGAGKAATLKILMNILRATRATRAKPSVPGLDSSRLSLAQLNQIGYVSENQPPPERLAVAVYFGYLSPFYAAWDNSLERSLRNQLALPAQSRNRSRCPPCPTRRIAPPRSDR